MKIAFRNFLTVLSRYKAASILNIAGLTLALTAFYIILVQVDWELGYNRGVPDSRNIYRIEVPSWYTQGGYSAWLNRPISEACIAAASQVEAGGTIWGGFSDAKGWVKRSEYDYDEFNIKTASVSRPFLDVFGYEAEEGDLEQFTTPGAAAISRSMARRLRVGIGDEVLFGDSPDRATNRYQIAAIYADFPENSLLGTNGFLYDMGDRCLDKSSEWSFNYYVRLHEGADPAAFEKSWMETLYTINGSESLSDEERQRIDEQYRARLLPLRDTYFASDAESSDRTGNRTTVYTLLGIAVLVVVIALINFVNFFFALVPVRLRTINTFKVFGAPVSSLRFNLMFEAFGLVIIAVILSQIAVALLGRSSFAGYLSTSLAVKDHMGILLLMIAIATFMALAASLYPARYITSFAPAMVVKGSFSGSRKGRRLRTLLLGVQYVISAGLIIATIFMHVQYRYMMHYDMGFQREHLLTVQISKQASESREALTERLLQNPQIAGATWASNNLINPSMGWTRMLRGERLAFRCFPVTHDFLTVMGIEVIEGRNFTPDDERKQDGTFIFNDCARRQFSLTLEDRIQGHSEATDIAGFCRDFNFESLRQEISPYAFYVFGANPWQGHEMRYGYIRTRPGADIDAVRRHIVESVHAFDASVDPSRIEVAFFDQKLGAQYYREQQLTSIITWFTLLAVGIALMGVFGIVLFETQHRRREIAVRKVMGATTGEVLGMFNRRFLILALTCFALAVPLSVWGIQRWLSTFAYRTPLHAWVFILTLAIILAVTLVTVTVRSWKAANENPSDSIKSE